VVLSPHMMGRTPVAHRRRSGPPRMVLFEPGFKPESRHSPLEFSRASGLEKSSSKELRVRMKKNTGTYARIEIPVFTGKGAPEKTHERRGLREFAPLRVEGPGPGPSILPCAIKDLSPTITPLAMDGAAARPLCGKHYCPGGNAAPRSRRTPRLGPPGRTYSAQNAVG